MKTLVIVVEGGVVQDVHRLPKGWLYSIHDKDVGEDNHNLDDKEVVRITVKGGMVESVENLPPGYDYEENDLD